MNLKNQRLINALLRKPVDKIPVWLMRQAGRYLPEYRDLRLQTPDFMTFCRTPELAARATLQPLERFDLDAAILFSDILIMPAAMGMDLQFIQGDGPRFLNPLRSQREIKKLKTQNIVDSLDYVFKAIQLIRENLKNRVPLIGFAGSPWTCATYMVEGGASKNFSVIKSLMFQQPHVLHELLHNLAEASIDYLNAQMTAGVQVVMIFDTWGGVLSSEDYQNFSLKYLQQIAQGLLRKKEGQIIPLILFTKGGGQWLDKIAASGCDAVGLDWMTDIKQARVMTQNKVALQGNLDPCLLLANPAQIERAVEKICTEYGPGPGHIFNLGHGVLPQTPPENVQVLVEAVHRFCPCS